MSADRSPASKRRLIIVGAGPAGLMAAIAAAQLGADVTVFEQLPAPGARLLSTGGGRCNLTNTLPPDAFMASFGRQGRFTEPALAAMGSSALRAFFDTLVLPTYSPDGIAVYPASNRAADVLEALLRRCRELAVVFRTGCEVAQILSREGQVLGVRGGGKDHPADAVVLATGGRSYPQLGGTGSGFVLAGEVGHQIVRPVPALVALLTAETWPGQCAGASIPDARVWIDLKGQSKAGRSGDVLFTHTGLSGPAVLDLSGEVSVLLAQRPTVPIRLACTPGTAAQWRARLDSWQRDLGRRHLRTLVGERVPAALATAFCELAGAADDLRAAHVPAAMRDALADLLTAAPLTVTATEGFAKAMVTRGGISLREVRPDTLESRLVRGLHFAGEVLDLDGPCGGFNLQWAFSSGYLAGLSAVGKGNI